MIRSNAILLSVFLVAPFGLAIYEDTTGRGGAEVYVGGPFSAAYEHERARAYEHELATSETRLETFRASRGGARVMSDTLFDDLPGTNAPLLPGRAGDRVANALTFRDDGTAELRLTQRWGPPTIAEDADGVQRFFWFNRQERVRAFLSKRSGVGELRIESYQPIEGVLAPRQPDRTPVRLRELIGEPQGAVAAAYGQGVKTTAELNAGVDLALDPIEFGDGPTRVVVRSAEGRVALIRLELSYQYNDGFTEQLLEMFEQMYGQPEIVAGSSGTLSFGGGISKAGSTAGSRTKAQTAARITVDYSAVDVLIVEIRK